MKADALKFYAALNSAEVDYYTIPQYQRPFTWEAEQYDTLWEDLCEAYRICEASKRELKPSESYFLGPVVFVKNPSRKSYDIIDGQQRITTFHILLWCLIKKLTQPTERERIKQLLNSIGGGSKLRVSAKDAATFLLVQDSPDDVSGSSRMAECIRYFRGKVENLADPDGFSEFLREFTQFIVIVADDYSKAWDLFIGLNGKGVPLNPTDLVKAFVCGQTGVGDEIGSIWEEKILPLRDASTPYFLFLSRFKGGRFVTENSLFKEITRQFPLTIKPRDIVVFSELFHSFWLKPIEQLAEEFQLSLDAKKSIRILRGLNRRDFTTVIFRFFETFGRDAIFESSFLKLFAAYQIRMAVARKRSRERKFSTELRSLAPIMDSQSTKSAKVDAREFALSKIREVLRADAPGDAEFEQMIKLSDYSLFPVRIILRHFEEGDRGDRIINDFEIEHLMPVAGTDEWFPAAGTADRAEYARIVNNIGNLFVVDSVTNNQIKNRRYEIKKQSYQDHLADWSIARMTFERNEWTRRDIEERAERIAQDAKETWRI
jgi:hypothetical protein